MFGTNASLVYGPQIQRHTSGLPNPTPLDGGGGVRFIQATDQQMLPHVVREWLQSVNSLNVK